VSRYTVHTSSIKALGKTRSDLDLLARALLTGADRPDGQVILHHRHALALPFPDGSFDPRVDAEQWQQIADKGRLYHGVFVRTGPSGYSFCQPTAPLSQRSMA